MLLSPYRNLFEQLLPSLPLIAQVKATIVGDDTPADVARYVDLVNLVFNIPGVGAPQQLTGYRITVFDAHGTVMVDTYELLVDNTYARWKAGIIGLNKNLRPSAITATLSVYGVGYESAFSPTLSENRDYVSVRLGPPYRNIGQVSIDQTAIGTISAYPIAGVTMP